MKKIVICQFWTNNLSYGKYTKLINEKYAKDNGYIYHLETNNEKIYNSVLGRSLTWYKPKFIIEVFEKYNPDYVLFLDADAIFVSNNYKIENFIDDKYDCIVTEDHGPSIMNAGVLLFKNTDWSKNFMNEWWEISDKTKGPNGELEGYYNNGLWHDQTCFGLLYNNNKTKIKIISNNILNSRTFKDENIDNFIFHAFAYGMVQNRTIDTSYYKLFNIKKPNTLLLSDMATNYNTDKHYEHNYFNLIYNDTFKDLKNSIKIFIEIGIDKGGSLELWRDYFINSKIIGADINLEYIKHFLKEEDMERIELNYIDQSDEDILNNFSNKYSNVDVILDDGSHRMRDQQITLAKLFKMLKSDGIFIIEDLHTSLEVVMPEKKVFGWGEPNKTITLDMLKNFQKTGIIISDYMSKDEIEYLNNNIKSVEIYKNRSDWSITSIIRKK